MAAALLLAYACLGATVVLWPTRVDNGIRDQLKSALSNTHGLWSMLDYAFVESLSNVLMFGPLGLLLTLMLARRLWWIAPLVGIVASTGAEVAQLLFLPDRVATMADVAANSLGAVLGTAIVLIARGGAPWLFRVPDGPSLRRVALRES